MRMVSRTLLALGLALLVASEAHAQVPSPVTSLCPSTATIAPNGSCCFDVIVRDVLGNPIPNSSVRVDFGTCVVAFCPAQPPGLTVVGNGVVAATNALGRATFCICASFVPPCNATIIADGVVLCTVPMLNNCSPTPTRNATWGRLKILYH